MHTDGLVHGMIADGGGHGGPCDAPTPSQPALARPATTTRPAPAHLEPPPSHRGALTVAVSRPPRAPERAETGTKARGPQRDLTTTPRPTTAGPRTPRTPLTPLHALLASPAARALLWRRVSAASQRPLRPPDGGLIGGASATRRRRARLRALSGGHSCHVIAGSRDVTLAPSRGS